MPPVRNRMGWRRLSQSLKSPVTLTTNALGVPDYKSYARHSKACGDVRAQFFVAFEMRAFAVKVQIEIRENWREAIRVIEFLP